MELGQGTFPTSSGHMAGLGRAGGSGSATGSEGSLTPGALGIVVEVPKRVITRSCQAVAESSRLVTGAVVVGPRLSQPVTTEQML